MLGFGTALYIVEESYYRNIEACRMALALSLKNHCLKNLDTHINMLSGLSGCQVYIEQIVLKV